VADPAALLILAAETASAAATFLREGREGLGSAGGDLTTKSSPTDIVTAMDRAAESMIVERLLDQRPDDGVLGEEGANRAGPSGVRWVIDPIDGTVNYLYRLPSWSVSIGVEVDGEVVAGVVHDGPCDVAWTALRGGGAFRNGARIGCSTETDLSQALLATGFSYVAERRRLQGQVVAGLLPRVRDIRRLGSAALDLCNAGAGHVDAYCEQSLNPWDLAAGGLIAREAGCRVEGLHGAPASDRLVIAAPPALFGQLHDLLAELRADEP
jgi:myo-inositol-1(or 4)-monophosphatase